MERDQQQPGQPSPPLPRQNNADRFAGISLGRPVSRLISFRNSFVVFRRAIPTCPPFFSFPNCLDLVLSGLTSPISSLAPFTGQGQGANTWLRGRGWTQYETPQGDLVPTGHAMLRALPHNILRHALTRHGLVAIIASPSYLSRLPLRVQPKERA